MSSWGSGRTLGGSSWGILLQNYIKQEISIKINGPSEELQESNSRVTGRGANEHESLLGSVL